jgi:putative ABC transport system permease protein
VRFATWKQPNGRSESVAVVGCDPDVPLGRPWNMVAGDAQQLKQPHSVIVDRIYVSKLGAPIIGSQAEINGYRATVVGFTKGIHAFTTSPYVFTTFKNALDYTGLNDDQVNFVLVKAAPGVNVKQLKADLQARLPDNDVFETAEFSAMTRHYWMFTTGAGVAVLMAAVLGLIVGIAVVAQTIYATTMDHIREYGTLKAMGAPNRYVLSVIMTQAAIAAVLGYAIGMTVSLFVVRGGETGGAYILLNWQTAAGLLFLTLAMCISAAIVSVNKILSLDPAIVFKG